MARARGVSLGVLFLVSSPRHHAAQPDWLAEAFQAYVIGHFEQANAGLVRELSSPVRVVAFQRELKRHAERWPQKAAAGFVLEAASVAATIVSEDMRSTGELTRILEIGCTRLRQSETPDLFELKWHLALFAFISGPAADRLGGRAEAFVWDDPVLEEHLAHVRKRFAGNLQITYALGVVREAAFHTWHRTHGIWWNRVWGDKVPTNWSWELPPRMAGRWLQEAAELFEAARGDEILRDEATLRLGLVRFHQERADEAVRLWSALSDVSDDTSLRYLARLFTARAMLELNRIQEAESGYRAALVIHPGTQSALIPLAALRFLAGDHSEATALVQRLINATQVTDPLWTYLEPGRRHWQERLRTVREAVQQ